MQSKCLAGSTEHIQFEQFPLLEIQTHTGIKNAPRSCVRRSPALTHSKQQAASVSRVSCLPAVVIVVLLSRASKAEAAICMEINSTGRSHELLFNRGWSVTAHHQLMDSSSHACPLPSPGLTQKLSQCQVWWI